MKTKIFSRIFGSGKRFVSRHKFISLCGLIAVFALAYWGFRTWGSTAGETRYVLASATKDTIIVSVTGSGQVSASNQIDLKPKASGDVISISAAEGKAVKSGALILQLDAREAQKAVRDATANLLSAKLALDKLQEPADTLSLIQAENTLARAKESKQTAQTDLQKMYDDGFNTISNVFLDLPTIMAGLRDVLYSSSPSLGGSGWNIDYYANAVAVYDSKVSVYRDDADQKYQLARTQYDKSFNNYKSVSRFSATSTIENVVGETYETTKAIAEAVKSANNLIQFYKDKLTERNSSYPAIVNTHLTSLNTYTSQTNSHLLNLSTVTNSIQSDKNTIINADRTIVENTESLAKLRAGVGQLDIQSAQLTITQRENALTDARDKLADYFIRAPFDGTVANINVKKSDSVGSGSIVATLITAQKVAEISLNEIDAAKIKVGQKATLTFDAIDGLSLTGKVVEIDTIGTVSQGVVTYGVKIGFDTQDSRVKSGMTVNAAVITDIRLNVLTVPSSAVKSQNGSSYIQMLDQPIAGGNDNQGVISQTPPQQKPVQVGLSNDTLVEITSGLVEGDQVVTRTITPTTSQTSQAPSLFGNPGARTTGGATRGVSR
jgi:HlyD family secretion protein